MRRGHRSFCPSLGTGPPLLLPIKNRIPSQTVCVFSQAPPGCCLPQHKTVTPCLSFLSHSLFSPLWLTFPSLFHLRPVYYQHVAHVLDKSRGSFTIGVGWQHLFLSPSPFFTLPFSILSCRGKRGPEESNNCDSGAFLALFLKLCRHTQGCLLALMKG